MNICIVSSDSQPQHKNTRSKFKPEEDKKLKKLVSKYGEKNWAEIAKIMCTRSGRQCRDRYCNYLKKGLTTKEWSPEEDESILKLVNEIGFHWVEIAKKLKGRSSNSIKNRWHKFLSKYQANPIIPELKKKAEQNEEKIIFKDPFESIVLFNNVDAELFPINN